MSDSLYHFAILRVVPHVHLGAFANVGVILHARTTEFLGMRCVSEPTRLARLADGIDQELLLRYLRRFEEICGGDPAGGPVALLPPSERFHWLTAPRSDVLQPSPIHEGVCADPSAALDKIFREMVPHG
jgi:hypothetical protein